MWHNRTKYFLTKDPNYIITTICYFPNINKTYQEYKEYVDIVRLQQDKKYLELYAYYNICEGGLEFIPLYFEDDVPKLGKLQKLYPQGHSHFWCLGYISKYVKGGNKTFLKGCKTINEPSLKVLLDWFKHYSTNYSNSVSNVVNQFFLKTYLRKYVQENIEKIDEKRKFQLLYNNDVSIRRNEELTVKDWIIHLENLPNRDIYEILVNDFI